MLKIRKIAIENFRGIKLPLEIEFGSGKNLTSVLVFGRNATGKSSLIDAWEWLNEFKIEGLNREGVLASDLPHKSSGGVNSYISVDFQHPTINNIKVAFDPAKVTTPTAEGQYDEFKTYSFYPNYLRYSDLQAFVYLSKTDKYKYLARFFGLDQFIANQDSISGSLAKLNSELEKYGATAEADVKKFREIGIADEINEESVLICLNQIAVMHQLAEAGSFSEAELIKIELAKVVSNNPKARELSGWKVFETACNTFFPVSSFKSECEGLEILFNELKENEETIKNTFLAELYQKAIGVIPSLADPTICPVCDLQFHDDLLQHVNQKHASLAPLIAKKNMFAEKLQKLLTTLDTLARKLALLSPSLTLGIQGRFNDFNTDTSRLAVLLPDFRAAANKDFAKLSPEDLSDKEVIEIVDRICTSEKDLKDQIASIITNLEADEATKNLAEDYRIVGNLISSFIELQVVHGKIDYLAPIVSDVKEIHAELTNHIQNEIQKTFDAISNDVIECFNELESTNNFISNPHVRLVEGRNRAIELEIDFAGETIRPAFKFLSESQINSFGLSIFLASVKHFNSNFKFFILDDVVNSFDAFKRPRISKLLSTKFSDFQILMLTHDDIFFETVKKMNPKWKGYKFYSWDYETGPKIMLSRGYVEEIQKLLDEDNPISAGQTLGRYLEWTFGSMNERLGTPIPYRLSNAYTLAEFYDPLVKRIKDKLKRGTDIHVLTKCFDELDQGGIFRNFCAHWKSEATPFTKEEIQSIFTKWLEIEAIMNCSDCKTLIKHEKLAGTEYVRCDCNNVNLKDNSQYTPAPVPGSLV